MGWNQERSSRKIEEEAEETKKGATELGANKAMVSGVAKYFYLFIYSGC
jgi:hypothetical protein